MASSPIKHVLSSDDVLPAEGVQAVYDEHDALVTAFQQQHSNYDSAKIIGGHSSWQQVGALLVVNTPEGITSKDKPVNKVVQHNVREVVLTGQAFTIRLDPNVDPRGTKAWVSSTFTGGPLTSEQMDYLTPKVSPSQELVDYWLVDFKIVVSSASADAIRRVSVVWYGMGGL